MKGGWFVPSESYEAGNFVIFKDIDPKNRVAIGAAESHINEFADKDSQKLMLIEQKDLIENLRSIARAERDKELSYILRKVETLPEGTLPSFRQKIKVLTESARRSTQPFLSALFNLFYQEQKHIDQITYEGKDGGYKGVDVLKNSVYERDFSHYLKEWLTSGFKGGQSLMRGAREFVAKSGKNELVSLDYMEDKTLDDLIEDYLMAFFGSEEYKNNYDQMVDKYRNDIKNSIKNNKYLKELLGSGRILKANEVVLPELVVQYNSDHKGKNKTIREAIKLLIGNIAPGMAAEVQSTMSAKKQVRTAVFKNVGKATGKTDVFGIDIVSGEVIAKLNTDNLRGSTGQEKMLNLIQDVKDQYSQISKDLFIINSSVKDYKSNNDFQLSGSSFKNSIDRIQQIYKGIESPIRRKKMTSADILGFALANTVEGGYYEDHRDEVLSQIAAVGVAYMFDDVEEMFEAKSDDNVLHVFYINGIYFSLSDLIYSVVDRDSGKMDIEELIDVGYSYKSGIIQDVNERYNRHDGSYPDPYARAEWEAVRDNVNDTQLMVKLRRDKIKSVGEIIRKVL